MATLRITNLTAVDQNMGDFYTTLPASAYIDITRPANRLGEMADLQDKIANSIVSLAVTYTADELASGLIMPPQAMQPQDLAPVAAATVMGGLSIVRIPMTAGVPGTADDVTAYAANALPFKFRVVDAWVRVVTAIALSTLEVRTQAAGAGTLLGTLSSATAGKAEVTDVTATAVATPGTLEGLFVRRSDRGVAGEVFLLIRPES